MDTVLPSLFLQVILIASNAFFAMSEFAVVSVNTQKMKRLAEGGSKPAARLLVITEAPSDFLATMSHELWALRCPAFWLRPQPRTASRTHWSPRCRSFPFPRLRCAA